MIFVHLFTARFMFLTLSVNFYVIVGFVTLLHSPTKWCKIQYSVCILSYKHDILHCALSHLSKGKTFFQIRPPNPKWPPSTVLKTIKSINSCMHQYLITKFRIKVKVWNQKAWLKVEAMVFNRVYNQESNMATKNRVFYMGD